MGEAFKVCSINFEPSEMDLCSACHAYRGGWIILILSILNNFTRGLNYIIRRIPHSPLQRSL